MNVWDTWRAVFNRQAEANRDVQAAEQLRKLDSQLAVNLRDIAEAFGRSGDVVAEALMLDASGGALVGCVYIQGLADVSAVQQFVKEPLLAGSGERTSGTESDEDAGEDAGDAAAFARQRADMPAFVKRHVTALDEGRTVADFADLYRTIADGDTVLLVDGCAYGWAARTAGGQGRSIEEPSAQTVVRGPRDGFTEALETNIALIRRRIKSPSLWLETLQIGRVTQTNVALLHIHGIANDSLVEEARKRLARIDIDGVLESGNIEELIQDETFTPFPTMYNSERPDVIAAGLLEGRVAVLVDGTPFVLMAPALFVQFYQSAEDYYQRAEFATLVRMLRYVCFYISLLAPSMYIAITTFHQELLPSQLLLSLAAQREGTPFPAFVEALIMEFIFEILREAGVRLPKAVGQTVSIVGALVIGQAAVEAGLVSPAMIIVVSITAISNFVIPAYSMGISIRIIRFILMVFAAVFGLFGVTAGLLALVQHLCSLRSFGVPYMSPLAPFNLQDQKDTVLRLPQWGLFSRPRFFSERNRIRENVAPTAKPRRTSRK